MIKHIVLFKLNMDGKQSINLIVSRLKELKEQISCIQDLEVGVNFADEDRAYDIALTVKLLSKNDLSEYAKHTKHIEFLGFVKPLVEKTKIVDYMI